MPQRGRRASPRSAGRRGIAAALALRAPGDRIERTGAQGGDALAAFAAGRPLAGLARVRFVHHGALRVPASVDAQVSAGAPLPVAGRRDAQRDRAR